MMEMNPVTSRQLAEVGHDPDTNTLRIRFADRINKKTGETIPGALYEYTNVPGEVFGLLMAANSHPDKSVGHAFGVHVKDGGFAYKRIDEDAPKEIAPAP